MDKITLKTRYIIYSRISTFRISRPSSTKRKNDDDVAIYLETTAFEEHNER